MDNNKDLNEVDKLINGHYIEQYKTTGEHLFSKKNRGVYWGTSLMMVALTFSLYEQGYMLETWMMFLLLPLLLLAFSQYVFRRGTKLGEAYLDRQMPKLSLDKLEGGNEGFKSFMHMSDLLDMMKIERRVVWQSALQIWLISSIILMSTDVSEPMFLLFLSLYAAIALVSAAYGAMAIVHLHKRCVYMSEHGFNL
ncbi:MAG: hypothetical protein Q9N02_10080 [Ghiorsea sp.]|nr:hypothetical protein [Ghiorsea sp.]